jgi:hypothetical protein
MSTIPLPHGNSALNTSTLISHIRSTGRDYIIQGQRNCAFGDHPKPSSLDYYLRNTIGPSDTKQATNSVINNLVATGLFVEGKFECPDNNCKCKGIAIVS